MGSSHGIGVTRNDYHRRDRRRNISTHCHSGGYNTEKRVSGVRVVKGGGLTRLHVQELNEPTEPLPFDESSEISAFLESLSSLDRTRFLYLPPFLKPEEVKRRRFGQSPSDRWWEWEEELELESWQGRPQQDND